MRTPSLRHDIAFARKKRARGEESGKLRARRKRHGTDRRGRFEGLPARLLRDGRVFGFPAALADAAEIERASGLELCGIAQRLGVDPEISRFDATQTGLQHERMGCIEVTFQAVATAFASA